MKIRLPLKMLDTSNPGTSTLPKGYSAVAGYIGGDTPHVWTAEQWTQFKGIPKLPIYVDDFKTGYAAGQADGWDCLQKLFALGVPKRVAIAYDIETSKDSARAHGFRSVLNWAGFTVWLYGSKNTVASIPFFDYWVADYTGKAHFPWRQARACQYLPGTLINGVRWDVSVIRWWQIRMHRLWT